MHSSFLLLISVLVALPSSAHAAGIPTYKQLVGMAAKTMQGAVGILFWVIFFYVAWVVVQSWSRHGDDPKAVTAGRDTLVAGILGLVVLGSLWGLVGFVRQMLLG